MKLYFAPMEGITTCIFRRAHAAMFPGADKYFAPFISPVSTGKFKTSLLRDVLPENNAGIPLVPQLLCNRAEPFVAAAQALRDMGYDEINLNIGCPSGTVVAKHKGAGMLADLQSMERCLDGIFSSCPTRISIKTRMGMESVSEFSDILEIYRKYPLSELIIHARARSGMYKSLPDIGAYSASIPACPFPVCYNGNIFKRSDMEAIKHRVPDTELIMLGRGAVANPALFRQLKGGTALSREELQSFFDCLLDEMLSSGLDARCTMARLKELWFYMSSNFPDNPARIKAVYKSQTISDYRSAVIGLFQSDSFSPKSGFIPPE